jgi:hypothetical protein
VAVIYSKETFVVDKIAKTIYSGNLSLIYHIKEVKEKRANDMYNHVSMNQVFEVSLEQLFKENPDQRATLNQIFN